MAEGISAQLDASFLEGAASLLDEINKLVFIILLDDRNIIGYLRSIDQFNNLFLSQAVERVYAGDKYGDIPLGSFLIRGDSVALVGELDGGKLRDKEMRMTKVSTDEILLLQRIENEEKREQRKAKKIAAKLRGNIAQIQDHDDDDD